MSDLYVAIGWIACCIINMVILAILQKGEEDDDAMITLLYGVLGLFGPAMLLILLLACIYKLVKHFFGNKEETNG